MADLSFFGPGITDEPLDASLKRVLAIRASRRVPKRLGKKSKSTSKPRVNKSITKAIDDLSADKLLELYKALGGTLDNEDS